MGVGGAPATACLGAALLCRTGTHATEEAHVKIDLSLDRRADLLRATKAHFLDRHDEEVGDLKAELLLDFFVEALGPPVYNQAVRDAHTFIHERLQDLEHSVYAVEDDTPEA